MLIDSVGSKRWSDLSPTEVSASSLASVTKSGRQSTVGQPPGMGSIKGRRVSPDDLLQRSDERCKRSINTRRFSIAQCWQDSIVFIRSSNFPRQLSVTSTCTSQDYSAMFVQITLFILSSPFRNTFYFLLAHLTSNKTSCCCRLLHLASFEFSLLATKHSKIWTSLLDFNTGSLADFCILHFLIWQGERMISLSVNQTWMNPSVSLLNVQSVISTLLKF